MFHPLQLLAGFIFGTLGWGVWRYGRTLDRWKPKLIGVALMTYPYLVPNLILLWVVGIALLVLFAFQHDA